MILFGRIAGILSKVFESADSAPKRILLAYIVGYVLLAVVMERYGKNVRDNTGVGLFRDIHCLPASLMMLCDAVALLRFAGVIWRGDWIWHIAPVMEIAAFVSLIRQAKASNPFMLALAQTMAHQVLSIPFAILSNMLCELFNTIADNRFLSLIAGLAFTYSLFELFKSRRERAALNQKAIYIFTKKHLLTVFAISAISWGALYMGAVKLWKPMLIFGAASGAVSVITALAFVFCNVRHYGKNCVAVVGLRAAANAAAILLACLPGALGGYIIIYDNKKELLAGMIVVMALLFLMMIFVIGVGLLFYVIWNI